MYLGAIFSQSLENLIRNFFGVLNIIFTNLLSFVADIFKIENQQGLDSKIRMISQISTGKSFSEALSLASTNP